jgi:hypothetical protein
VEGKEVVCMEEFCSWFRDGASVDKGDDVNEGGEVR